MNEQGAAKNDESTNNTSINNNTNGGLFIVDTVLAFIRHGMNVATEDNTIKVANTTFCLAEIKTACNVLWDKCNLGPPPARQTSVNRSQSEALLADIVEMFVKLEGENKTPPLYVDVEGMAMFPKFNVEDVNEVAMVEKLRRMEHKMFSMTNMMNDYVDDIGAIKQNIISVQQNLQTHCDSCKSDVQVTHDMLSDDNVNKQRNSLDNATADHTTVTGQQTQFNNRSADEVDQLANVETITPEPLNQPGTSRQSENGANNVSGARKTGKNSRNNEKSRPQGQKHVKTGANNEASKEQPITMASLVKAISDSQEQWKVQTSKRDTKHRTKDKKDIYGTSNNSFIKAGPEPMREIFISGIDNETHTMDDLKKYLESCDICVNKLFLLSGDRSRASYLVVVPKSHFNKVLNEELWSQGIHVRAFERK